MVQPMVLEAVSLLLLSWLIAVFYLLQMDHGMARGIGLLFGAVKPRGRKNRPSWPSSIVDILSAWW